MSQEMSFAQALNEARQIIVQQSNRIKSDLDRARAMQETINGHAAALSESDRLLKQKTTDLDASAEQLKQMTGKFEEARVAKEQAEAVIDRQGQRLTQMQESIAALEKQAAEQTATIKQLTAEIEATRTHLPTQEDADALAALSSLLAAKKGGSVKPVPATEEAAAA
jgi:predicted  nucleic acid-binding Zn-ribbon protein